MVFYGRTANEHVDLTLALVVEGIPVALVERTIAGAPAGLGGRSQVVCITRVEEGESSLSYEERRETAATLDVDMLDTDADLFRTLFAAGTRAVGWIIANATAADGTLFFNSTAGFTNGDYVYIGAETVLIDGINSATESDVGRGEFGSTASVVRGEASDGDSVYLVPPYWRGRRASLYGYTAQGDETLLGTYIVDEAPIHNGDKAWSLRLAGIVQEYFERSVGVGLRSQAITAFPSFTPTARTLRVEDASAFRTASAFPAYVIAEGGDIAGIFELTSLDTGTGEVVIAREPSFRTRSPFNVTGITEITLRPLAVVGSSSPLALLYVLLSSEGQAATTYDRLPGRPSASTYDFGWRMGAGFAVGEIDVAAFTAITAIPSNTITIGEERKATDVLREWCLLTGTAIVSTVDGKLKPITLAAQRTANTRSIGADDVIPDGTVSVEHDESGVSPLLTVRAKYDPVTGDFGREINLIDSDLAKRYRRTPQRREIEIRSIGIGRFERLPANVRLSSWANPSSVTTGEMVGIVNDVMRGDGALARRFVRLSLTHQHLDLRIGDLVTISTDLPDAFIVLPDMRGSTIAGVTARVVARRPRYDQARVDVRLEILDRLLHVCPAAVIESVAGTTVTLATAGPELTSATPSAEFWAGAFVRIIDRSQGGGAGAPFFASVVSIPNGTDLELGAVPVVGTDGWEIQAIADYLVLDPDNSSNGTSGSGYFLVEAAMLAGDDGVAGSNPSATTTPRWR